MGKTVLIVEDEKAIVEILKLTSSGRGTASWKHWTAKPDWSWRRRRIPTSFCWM